MPEVKITEQLLAKAGGWQVLKEAKAAWQNGKVISYNWTPPFLKGVVQSGAGTVRAMLKIDSEIDVENLCSCYDSKEYGKICVHSVALGVAYLHQAVKPSANGGSSDGRNSSPTPGLATSQPQAPLNKQAASLHPRLLKRLPRVGTAYSEGQPQPAELVIICPPDMHAAWEKQKLTIVIEAVHAKGQQMLHALPKQYAYQFSEQDRAIIDFLESLVTEGTPGMVMFTRLEFLKLLPLLKNHPHVACGRSHKVHVHSEPMTSVLHLKEDPDHRFSLELQTPVAVDALPLYLVDGKFHQGWVNAGYDFWPLAQVLPPPLHTLYREGVQIARSKWPSFVTHELPLLKNHFKVEISVPVESLEIKPKAPTFMLTLDGSLNYLNALLQCTYDHQVLTVGVTDSQEEVFMQDPQNPNRFLSRDRQAERDALNLLKSMGFNMPMPNHRWNMNEQAKVLSFFAKHLPRLEKLGWKISYSEKLEQYSKSVDRIQPQVRIFPSGSGMNWFEMELEFTSQKGKQKIPASEIQRLLQTGQSYIKTGPADFILFQAEEIEELQHVLKDCEVHQDAQSKKFQINRMHAAYLESSLNKSSTVLSQAPPEWKQLTSKQNQLQPIASVKLSENLEGILRPYQKEGVAWLHFLYTNQFGGILADEMGLGKTLQTLAFLDHERKEVPKTDRKPCLIVCPTTLVFNWINEIQKFTPHLRYLAVHGPARENLFSEISNCDVVVTSYALLRRDQDRYKDIEFDTVILDEAQNIKNRQTQNAQSAKMIRSRHRLVLTGTPIENSVFDLWSIMDFLMPGYLGTYEHFRDAYEQPITKFKSKEAQSRLARRLRPFLLRRLKKDVIKDLPDKIQQVAYCEMSDTQKELYKAVLESSRREIHEAVGEKGFNQSRIMIFTALMRLRQICCDLRLLKLENVPHDEISGKVELFKDLLNETINGGHRVLVFSQFVSMLHLLENHLKADGIPYSYLDGETRDRIGQVEKFQSDANIPVFLISLKAGGTGLNLTAADTVFHFDPWWNPSVEAQATDRAHRIGQQHVVTSIKLITRGTVEEKILKLQQQKKALIDATIESEEQLTQNLTWNEIQELLEG